jgi:glycine dehydrogenase subunit 1
MAFAGQCVGLFACDDAFARHMPGRVVGETVDADGNRGFVLTMQAREQHIKREKAGSNICTNQTLFALAVAVHLAWLGPVGLKRIGEISYSLAHAAAGWIDAQTPFRIASSRSFVREFALRGPKPAAEVIAELRNRGIWAGPSATEHDDVFNVALTERRTMAEVDALVEALREVGKS